MQALLNLKIVFEISSFSVGDFFGYLNFLIYVLNLFYIYFSYLFENLSNWKTILGMKWPSG